MDETQETRKRRISWFQDARFGLFLHWGLYSIPAKMEWIRSVDRMDEKRYRAYFDAFDPVDYDPRAWARQAKNAGMKYAVLTAKHHDGFCLFDSELTDFKATNTRAQRDLVAEYVDAFRAEGLRVGLYYSLLDWHHPDYPHYEDRHHPQRDDEAWKGKVHAWDRYVDYMHGQVRELCSNYGKLDILWFDFSYDDMAGDKWRAEELMRMVRSLQPDIIVDNRLEASGSCLGSIYSGNPSSYAGDFVSPEQIIPPGGITDAKGRPLPWEACITMNNHWGYSAADRQWKTPHQIIRKLVECVAKGGNLILNVGPDARGCFPEASSRILDHIGHWIAKNGDSIYGCGAADAPKPEWGYYTARGTTLYAHVFEAPIGPLHVSGLSAQKIEKSRLLSDHSELRPVEAWNASYLSGDAFVNFGDTPELTYPLPDEDDTVIELTLRPSE